MFASKRCKLVKRLWEESSKLVASYLSSPAQPPLWAAAAGDYDAFCSSPEERKAVECLLKRLRDSQLETMLRAVQTRGRDGTACLPLPHGDVKLPREVVAPHVLCCRLWRWPQLRHQYELKRLPWCAASPLHVCCNPYHWSIVHKPGTPTAVFAASSATRRVYLYFPGNTGAGRESERRRGEGKRAHCSEMIVPAFSERGLRTVR
ncbi:hypothetical protein HPB48_004738 [Haemaphysalis longicornis]|uniref:MH1 domain-containing protein n=1 Tax=Haemaphysalis longicornis TaxID=44386 RepID=A0A9J6G174_HAELO|nr:hypothetical protein HPB48_004738 [Haemaphysalis longicornis]